MRGEVLHVEHLRRGDGKGAGAMPFQPAAEPQRDLVQQQVGVEIDLCIQRRWTVHQRLEDRCGEFDGQGDSPNEGLEQIWRSGLDALKHRQIGHPRQVGPQGVSMLLQSLGDVSHDSSSPDHFYAFANRRSFSLSLSSRVSAAWPASTVCGRLVPCRRRLRGLRATRLRGNGSAPELLDDVDDGFRRPEALGASPTHPAPSPGRGSVDEDYTVGVRMRHRPHMRQVVFHRSLKLYSAENAHL